MYICVYVCMHLRKDIYRMQALGITIRDGIHLQFGLLSIAGRGFLVGVWELNWWMRKHLYARLYHS